MSESISTVSSQFLSCVGFLKKNMPNVSILCPFEYCPVRKMRVESHTVSVDAIILSLIYSHREFYKKQAEIPSCERPNSVQNIAIMLDYGLPYRGYSPVPVTCIEKYATYSQLLIHFIHLSMFGRHKPGSLKRNTALEQVQYKSGPGGGPSMQKE